MSDYSVERLVKFLTFPGAGPPDIQPTQLGAGFTGPLVNIAVSATNTQSFCQIDGLLLAVENGVRSGIHSTAFDHAEQLSDQRAACSYERINARWINR